MADYSLQIKAILLKDGTENGRKEIRRFRVAEDSVGVGVGERFQSLLAHVHSVFNIDTTTLHCSLFWKDEDDDLVQFSTDDELRHAADSMDDDTFRIFVIVTPRVQEDSSSGPRAESATNFQPPPPPHFPWQWTGPSNPPPPPPPPFMGPCGWKKWKHKGHCGWRGGWKGGLDFGWPGAMGYGGHGCGWKGKGLFKHGFGHKWKKNVFKRHLMAVKKQNEKEFQTVRQQVPGEFRSWVRQFVHTWYSQGAEAALTTARDKLPKGVGPDFPQWLLTFLSNYRPYSSTATSGEQDGETGMDGVREGETGAAPEGVPPVYLRWLRLFMTRFYCQESTAFDCEEDHGPHCPRGGHGRRGHGRWGKHGCHKKKRGKHGGWSSSSESEDSDSEEKAWRNVPKGLRKFVRMSMKQLHKKKGDNPKIKAKAQRAGVTPKVQEFVDQVLLEWHAKLSRQPPRVVATQMMEGERTLPTGLEREHFLWLCRFMARWHCRHAGKCDMMAGWSSGDTTTDDSSGDDTTPPGQGCGPCPPFPSSHFRATMGGMHRPPPPGMMGPPPPGMMGHPHFGMHFGMDQPPPRPCAPPMFGGWFPPPPAYTCGSGDQSSDAAMDCEGSRNQGPREGQGRQDQGTNGQRRTSKDDMVDHVTEGVKRL